MEDEAGIRTKSLAELSSHNLSRGSSGMGRASRQGLVMKKSSRSDWKQHILNGLLHLNECIEKSIGQLAGYLSRSTFKKHNCEACHSQLVRSVHLEVAALHLEPMEAAFHSWRLKEA